MTENQYRAKLRDLGHQLALACERRHSLNAIHLLILGIIGTRSVWENQFQPLPRQEEDPDAS